MLKTYIITLKDDSTIGLVSRNIRNNGGEVTKIYHKFNILIARIPEEEKDFIGRTKGVTSIKEDGEMGIC